MGMTLWEHYSVTGAELHRCPGVHLHEALALGDEMKDHDALGTRFEQRSRKVGARGLIAPGRAEAAVDEDGADQSHNP